MLKPTNPIRPVPRNQVTSGSNTATQPPILQVHTRIAGIDSVPEDCKLCTSVGVAKEGAVARTTHPEEGQQEGYGLVREWYVRRPPAQRCALLPDRLRGKEQWRPDYCRPTGVELPLRRDQIATHARCGMALELD